VFTDASLDRVAKLLLERGADVSATSSDEMTPLQFATLGGHELMARLLLKHGADVSAQDKAGASPLQDAATSGRGAMVRLLLAHGASVSCQDKNGLTPLVFAGPRRGRAAAASSSSKRPLGLRCCTPSDVPVKPWAKPIQRARTWPIL